MQFSQKLDFLMNITKTTNSALALYISLDASHISRLRRGQRNASKKETYLQNMATYFSRHCTEEYQRKALLDTLKIKPFPYNEKELSKYILDWFINDIKNDEHKTVEQFLDDFSNPKSKESILKKNLLEDNTVIYSEAETSIFYGPTGKQEAVIHFLSEIIASKEPRTLLLFSDEDMSWLTEDHHFTLKWASLMYQVIAKGNKIKVIHTVSRNLDEMLEAISQWMPLYMSGAIEPYFYPKKRDGIFKQTLFIAPDVAAIVSRSVGDMISKAANVLFRDKKAVESFAEEYNQYLNLCKSLMRIYTAKDEKAYMANLFQFEKLQSNSIIKTESLSLLTIPESLAKNILSRLNYDDNNFLHYHQIRTQTFEKSIHKNIFTEIISLPEIMDVKTNKVKIAFSDMLEGGKAYYTQDEYIQHLQNIILLLKTYENFHVHLIKGVHEESYMLYAKEDIGVLVAKTTSPPVVLAIDENNMIAAFWDFLKNIIGEKKYYNPNNKETAKQLSDYIKLLKENDSL